MKYNIFHSEKATTMTKNAMVSQNHPTALIP